MKISLIGLGYIGRIHLRLLKDHPHWELAGIYDIDAKVLDELAREYGVYAFASQEEAISASDAVDICTPSTTHYEIARACVVAGKHVFVEKPVTSNIKDARRLQKLVTEGRVVLQAGHVERFNPAFTAALPFLAAPAFIEVHRLARYNPRGTDVSVVLDLMMHDLDLILSIVDSPVKRIHANGTALVSDTADIASARIEFSNGCVANVTTNRMAFVNSRKFRVFTRQHLVSINLLEKTTEVISIRDANKDDDPKSVLDPGNGRAKAVTVEQPPILQINAINEELSTFHQSIHSNRPSRVGIDDAIRTLEVAFEIEARLAGHV